MANEAKKGWRRHCGACGSERVTSKGGLFHCQDCKRTETEDPWLQCPHCGGQVLQKRVFKAGAYITGERSCTECSYRLTFESRVTHQQLPGEKQPGPYRWMTQILGRITRDP
jgi:DNA-directed RNA polymerase subunit RPC12/RpoP